MSRWPISTRPIPGLGALGRVNAVEYHLGSHRYIDEAGLCRPEFHIQLGQAEKLGRDGGRPDGAIGPAGLDPAGRSAAARGGARCWPSCTSWAFKRSC